MACYNVFIVKGLLYPFIKKRSWGLCVNEKYMILAKDQHYGSTTDDDSRNERNSLSHGMDLVISVKRHARIARER